MLKQLLINHDFEFALMVGLTVILGVLTLISLFYCRYVLIVDKDKVLAVMLLGVSVIGVSSSYVSYTQIDKKSNEIKAIQKGHVEDYYSLKKDGKAIKLVIKESKSDLLRKQAEAKIIDEDSKTYQVQYKDTIDRIPKSAVK